MYSIKNKIYSSRKNNKINESKVELIKEIEDLQKQKSKILINLGSITYEKIRKSEIIDNDLKSNCEGLKELDKLIYDLNNKIDKLEYEENVKCDCGAKLDMNNKFCSECGKKIEYSTESIGTCKECSSEIKEDYAYCVCCGNKL